MAVGEIRQGALQHRRGPGRKRGVRGRLCGAGGEFRNDGAADEMRRAEAAAVSRLDAPASPMARARAARKNWAVRTAKGKAAGAAVRGDQAADRAADAAGAAEQPSIRSRQGSWRAWRSIRRRTSGSSFEQVGFDLRLLRVRRGSGQYPGRGNTTWCSSTRRGSCRRRGSTHVNACVRARTNGFQADVPHAEPGGPSHGYLSGCSSTDGLSRGAGRRLQLRAGVGDGQIRVLLERQPDYLQQQLETLPPKLREAWLHGSWDVYEGQFLRTSGTEHHRDRRGGRMSLSRLCRTRVDGLPDYDFG